MERKDFGLPDDKILLLYGGNLGKPQDLDFIIQCLKTLENQDQVHVVISGTGGEQHKLETYIDHYNPKHFSYLGQLDMEKYTQLTFLCDIGLIFLDYRFTIPNFPQRLLSYMEASNSGFGSN